MNQEHSFSHHVPHIKSQEKKYERSISEELEQYSKDSDSDELFSSSPDIPWLEVKTYKNAHKKIPILDRWTIGDCQKQLDDWYNNAEQRTHHIEESLHYLKRLEFLFEKGTKGSSSLAVFRPSFARDNNGYYNLHGLSRGTAYYFLIKKTKHVNHLPPLKTIPEIGLHSSNNEEEQSLIEAIKQVCNYRQIKFTQDKDNEYAQHIYYPMHNQCLMPPEYQHHIQASIERQHSRYMGYPPVFYPSTSNPYFMPVQTCILIPPTYSFIPAFHQAREPYYPSEVYPFPSMYYTPPASYQKPQYTTTQNQEPQQSACHNSYSETSSQIIKNASESNIAFFNAHYQNSHWSNNVSTHNNHNTQESDTPLNNVRG